MINDEETWFKTPRLLQDSEPVGDNCPNFKESIFFINNSDHTFTVVMRNNLLIKVKTAMTNILHSNNMLGKNTFINTNTFIIRRILDFNDNDTLKCTLSNINEFKRLFANKNYELDLIHKQIRDLLEGDYLASRKRIVLDYIFDTRELIDHGNFYARDTDILIHHVDSDLIPHPYSVEGSGIVELKDQVKDRKRSGVLIDIIDNSNVISNRYITLANNVFKIPVHNDTTKPDGVYVTFLQSDNLGNTDIQPVHYNFEEAEEIIGLCRTKEEAISAGDTSEKNKQHTLALERKLLDAKNEHEQLKMVLNETKTKLELNKLEREEAINQTKFERDRELSEYRHRLEIEITKNAEIQRNSDLALNDLKHKLEKSKIKAQKTKEKLEKKQVKRKIEYEDHSRVRDDYYETRSYERKDSYESVKTAGLIAAGCLGLYAVFKK